MKSAIRILGVLMAIGAMGLCGQRLRAQGTQPPAAAQPDVAAQVRQLAQGQRSTDQALEVIIKRAEDIVWYLKLGDVADVDKIEITSTKPIRMANPTGQGAGNPLIIYAYTFTPKKLAAGQKAPLVVFVHGGVHANFDLVYVDRKSVV